MLLAAMPAELSRWLPHAYAGSISTPAQTLVLRLWPPTAATPALDNVTHGRRTASAHPSP